MTSSPETLVRFPCPFHTYFNEFYYVYYTKYYFFVTDSHCECGDDWLRPLLQRIKDEPKSFVVPIIGMMISYNKSL